MKTIIDPYMFPTEYKAIEAIKERSRQFERDREKRREAKQALIEECKRRINEQEHSE